MIGIAKKVLIVNDREDCGMPYTPLFTQFGEVTQDIHTFKLTPFKFRLVVFTGGADVRPELYGDTSPRGYCHSDVSRDTAEVNIFRFAAQHKIKMAGICRGMQFINVMTGGKMVHDLAGHNKPHAVMTKDKNEPFETNSFHHQMCIPHKDTHLLAWANEKQSETYVGDKDELIEYKGPEVEAIYSSEFGAVGVQWHPEVLMSSSEGSTWFSHLVRDLLSTTIFSFKKHYLGRESTSLTITEV